jgi:hypothetical protein
MPARLALIALLAAAAIPAGCTSRPPELAPVSGRVTFAGAPVAGSVIVFSPDVESGCYGPCASAETGPDGRYTLATNGQSGATPGWHRVTIATLVAHSGRRLPDRFRDPNLSRLRAEVRPGRDNPLDFQLEEP